MKEIYALIIAIEWLSHTGVYVDVKLITSSEIIVESTQASIRTEDYRYSHISPILSCT